MSGRHTPGPWERRGGSLFAPSSGFHVLRLAWPTQSRLMHSSPGRHVANMHLIAAAPDLYDAAVAAEAALGKQRRRDGSTDPVAVALAKLRAALAAARGESA